MRKTSVDTEEVESEACYPISLQDVHDDLYRTYFDCQIRGLTQSCKWIGDLMYALDSDKESKRTPNTTKCLIPAFPLAALPARQLSTFMLARSLFDAREYDHCSHTLNELVWPLMRSIRGISEKDDECHPLIYFLYIYASYMACEKRRANDEVELRRVYEPDGSSKPAQVAHARCNKQLSALRGELESQMKPGNLDSDEVDEALNATDPYVLYAFGLIYRTLGMATTAIKLFTRAINTNSCLWPAWYELSQLITNKEQLVSLKLPSGSKHWMSYFFEAKVFLKLNESERALDILHRLSKSGFNRSGNLQGDIGLAYDGLREMEMASRQFYELFNSFPYRLDNVDAYSNVLFVREESVELAHLAHHCVRLDKYRPETCCVVGNFFSLRGQHDKAVIYFQRALKLKPSYAQVWTLVGHEYTELRNTHAAMHAYRQAIALNRHDYRAWYGLGQMYEMLSLPSFALYYYREAQYLVPTDSRLIVALGEIYERLNRLDEAKKCYWRAHCVGDIEGSALFRLALCFAQSSEVPEAAAAYTEFIKLCEHNGVQNQTELAQAYKFLATYHLQMGHYEDSAAAASKCLEFPETREEAKAMFRQITMLAGDVEVALTDQTSDDPPSTDDVNEEDDEATVDTRSKAAGDESSSRSTKLDPDILPGSSVLNETSGGVNQRQPLDLSLGFLLACLGESNKPRENETLTPLIPAGVVTGTVTPTITTAIIPVTPAAPIHSMAMSTITTGRLFPPSHSSTATATLLLPSPASATAVVGTHHLPSSLAVTSLTGGLVDILLVGQRISQQVPPNGSDTDESMRLSDAD